MSDTFNMANPDIAQETSDVYNPNATSNTPPRPPRSGFYLVQPDFAETDPEKRFQYGTKADPEKNYVATALKFTITACEDVTYPEKYWLGRKLGGAFGFRLDSRKNGALLNDFLTAKGVTAKERTAAMKDAKTYAESGMAELITDAIANGSPIRVWCDWEWSGKTETLRTDDDKPFYLRRSYDRDSPLHAIPEGMKAHPLDHSTGEHPFHVEFEFTAPEGPNEGETETVTLYAELAIKRFTPLKK